MTTSNLAERVKTWLSSAWHVKVPAQWLEACIDWIQQENGSSNLAQAHINKQVYEQWLLTDLRDLEYPILPDNISNTPKGELNDFYSIQIDSLVDVSQPAYSQLQKIRGKNTVNEEITANTQGSLKSWEARPTRMLVMQLTDGIHHIQGMEYLPIPALHSSLLPGTKIMIQGKVVYRLGVLLLKPENVRLLGGEVDSLVEEYAEERVLARLIGENPTPVRSNIGESEITRPIQETGPSDEELLASLGENDELMINEACPESGYCSRSTSLNSTTHSLPYNNGSCLQQDPAVLNEENKETCIPALECMDDFDELPWDDDLFLEEGIHEGQMQVENRSSSINNQLHGEDKFVDREMCGTFQDSTGGIPIKHNVQHIHNLDGSLGNKFFEGRGSKIDSNEMSSNTFNNRINAGFDLSSDYLQTCKVRDNCHKVGLDTPPFTYISVLLNNKPTVTSTVKVKAFIVTLTGNLTSSGGFWKITAKISDGTGYLEVDFADEILTSLIGFSVPEMKQMKKDCALHPKLNEGLQNCQRELIDLCCLMTIEFNPSQTRAVVMVLQDIHVNDVNNLKKRLNICST
ncbi:recQ-mediated genome instability protein 1 [Tiliqua scincoides]|uniref:recQ-mediated genome instability protein 1 n=1 Tax=Tiliqua scincoides TaxID=71010 RepID=UPI003461973E